MTDSADNPTQPATPAPSTPEPSTAAESSPADSATFSRCADCKHSAETNPAAGTLLCKKHNMHVNAEADEIPDDCVEHEPTTLNDTGDDKR